MVRMFQFKVLVAAPALGAAIYAASATENVSAQENPSSNARVTDKALRGCWERTDRSTRYPTSLTFCFLANGELQGWDIHNGHGVDFGGRWSFVKSGRLRIKVGKAGNVCSMQLNASRTTLVLEACNDVGLNGAFEKTKDWLAH